MDGTTRQVRIGLIGCGQLAHLAHLRIVSGLPGVRLVAIAEADEGRREAARRMTPAPRGVADYRELLALDEIDAVVITLPPDLHAEAAIAAHRAGMHVYLEKPLATDLDDGKAVVDAWRESGRVGMIGFNYRFNRLYREAKDLIVAGPPGRLVAVRTVFSSKKRAQPVWMGDRGRGGGVLLDLASHHVDLVRWLFGEIAEVGCRLHAGGSEGDTATLELFTRDGLPVQSFFSHRASDEDRVEIYCDNGSIKIDRRHGLVVELSSGHDSAHRRDQLRHAWRSVRSAGYAMEKRRAFGHEPSWRYALEHFIDAVRGKHAASPDFNDGLSSLSVVLAAEESARDGRRVRLDTSEEDA